MAITPAIVDCMACLVTGVLTPVGFRDESGVVHRVKWHVHGGPYKLCDFVEPEKNGMRVDAKAIRLLESLVSVEEP